jgi:hypothetical protein
MDQSRLYFQRTRLCLILTALRSEGDLVRFSSSPPVVVQALPTSNLPNFYRSYTGTHSISIDFTGFHSIGLR